MIHVFIKGLDSFFVGLRGNFMVFNIVECLRFESEFMSEACFAAYYFRFLCSMLDDELLFAIMMCTFALSWVLGYTAPINFEG